MNFVKSQDYNVSNLYLLLNGPGLVLFKIVILKQRYDALNFAFDCVYIISFIGKLTKSWNDSESFNYLNLWLLLLSTQIFHGNGYHSGDDNKGDYD